MMEMFYGCHKPTTEENQNEHVLMFIRQSYFNPDCFQEHSLIVLFFSISLIPYTLYRATVDQLI